MRTETAIVYLVTLFGLSQQYVLPSDGEAICINPLGMKDGTIQDSQITASSQWNAKHGAINGRLDMPAGDTSTGGWSPSSDDINQWIQTEFDALTDVYGIVLQGGAGTGQSVTTYNVEYSNDGISWQYVKDIDQENVMVFNGNTDDSSKVTSLFMSPVSALYIRIRPTKWLWHISMRYEILGTRGLQDQDTDECEYGIFSECEYGLDNCNENADCTNQGNSTEGHFICVCRQGWEGDGIVCTDIDECADKLHNCGENTECINTDGSFTCECSIGWHGDGVTCTDMDECADRLDNCDENAECINTAGDFTCKCNEGWLGDGVTCAVCSNSPLGMENGKIPDSSITANHYKIQKKNKDFDRLPQYARLNQQRFWAAYISQQPWIQVDLQTITTVNGLMTQGDHGRKDYWIAKVKIETGTSETALTTVLNAQGGEMFDANTDGFTTATIYWPMPIATRFVRITPVECVVEGKSGTCVLKFEILGDMC